MLIFAIDDELNALKDMEGVIRKATGSEDAEIVLFTRCADALDAIEGGMLPEVVFSDIVMPGLSGMEFAKCLKDVAPDAKVIFVSAHEKYAIEAFKIKAYGYLLKPLNEEDVRREIGSIPAPDTPDKGKLVVRCFGHFDVFWQGKPLIFARKQSKELLAYLIDRGGASCTSGEIATALWKEGQDSRAEQNRIRVLVNDLRSTLRSIGMEDVLIREHRELAIRRDLLECDYYRMLEGNADKLNSYRGKYMVDYGWAELTNANLFFGKSREGHR